MGLTSSALDRTPYLSYGEPESELAIPAAAQTFSASADRLRCGHSDPRERPSAGRISTHGKMAQMEEAPRAAGIEVIGRRLASVGLPGAESDPVEVPDDDWPRLIRYIARQRITGFASAEVRAGSLLLTEQQSDELEAEHRSAIAMVLVLEHLLVELSSEMSEAGLPTVVLKGAAVADTFYPERSWRSYGDLDLLVSAADWRRACEVLAGLGFRRIIPEPRPGFDERFGKGASFEDARKLQVDLHRTLSMGPFGLWIDPKALLEGTTMFPMKDASLRRLDDANALIHACIHAALGRQYPQLVPLRDVLQMAWSGRVDWELFSGRMLAWRLTAPVSHAMRTASATLDVPLPDDVKDVLRTPVGAIERRALRAYTTDRKRRGGPELSALWAIPGLRSRVAFVRAMLFPDRRFLEAEGRSGTLRRRWMVPIRWAGARFRQAAPWRRRGPRQDGPGLP